LEIARIENKSNPNWDEEREKILLANKIATASKYLNIFML